VFCGPIVGPDDYFVPPAWLMEAVREVAGSVAPTPKGPPVVFKTDPASLERNAELMKDHDYCLGSLLRTTAGTTMDPSAEFRPIEQLDRIYNGHPNYSFVRTMIIEGMDYVHSHELTEEQRTAELEANLLRGNHKSAAESNDHLTRLLSRSVAYGFDMPFPTQIIARMNEGRDGPAGRTGEPVLVTRRWVPSPQAALDTRPYVHHHGPRSARQLSDHDGRVPRDDI
jgi:hypothetical protein